MYHRILLTLDGNPERQAAAAHALNLAETCKAELLIMSAVRLERRTNRTASGVAVTELSAQLGLAQQQIAAVVDQARARGVQASGFLVEMAPVAGILKLIAEQQPDLVIMTPHSATILGLPISRTTLRVIRASPVPVLLVRERK